MSKTEWTKKIIIIVIGSIIAAYGITLALYVLHGREHCVPSSYGTYP